MTTNGRRTRRAAHIALACALAWIGLACAERHAVEGIVERLDDDWDQVVLVAEGLPHGSQAFRAADDLREGLTVGHVVTGEYVEGETQPVLVSVRVERFADQSDGWIESGGERLAAERAPPIALEDTEGRPVSLADLAGTVLLADFIFTSCPGPCPAQTHNMVLVQKRLSEQAKPHVRLISVTIDPETDDGPTLRAYAERHGADLSGWSFLTGPVELVEETYGRYGIGVSMGEGGDMDHTLRSFLIDDRGFLIERYRSDVFDPDAVVARLEALARDAATRDAS